MEVSKRDDVDNIWRKGVSVSRGCNSKTISLQYGAADADVGGDSSDSRHV